MRRNSNLTRIPLLRRNQKEYLLRTASGSSKLRAKMQGSGCASLIVLRMVLEQELAAIDKLPIYIMINIKKYY